MNVESVPNLVSGFGKAFDTESSPGEAGPVISFLLFSQSDHDLAENEVVYAQARRLSRGQQISEREVIRQVEAFWCQQSQRLTDTGKFNSPQMTDVGTDFALK
jgi:hypothetical protein